MRTPSPGAKSLAPEDDSFIRRLKVSKLLPLDLVCANAACGTTNGTPVPQVTKNMAKERHRISAIRKFPLDLITIHMSCFKQSLAGDRAGFFHTSSALAMQKDASGMTCPFCAT